MENHLNCKFYWSNFCQIYTIVLKVISLFFRTRFFSPLSYAHRANLRTISLYSVRFSTDTVQNNNISVLPCSLVSFTFLFSLVSFAFCLCVCLFFYLKQKIYILMDISPCGRVSNKNTTFLAIKYLTYFGVIAKNLSYFGIYKNIVLYLF